MDPVPTSSHRHPLSKVEEDRLQRPNTLSTKLADAAEMPLPSNPQTFFVGGLFALAVLAVL
jgi:hypothetical protein